MLDSTETPIVEPVEGEADPSAQIIKVKITKGGEIAVDMNQIHDRIYPHVLIHGLQKLVNRKTKGNTTDADGKAISNAARAKANLAAMYDGSYKIVGAKSDSGKASGPVMVEARRLAKLAIKAEIKAGNITAADGTKLKVAHVAATEYTRLANELIEADPSYIKQAEASLKAATVPTKAAHALKVSVDPKLVKAAEDKKAKAKATAGQTLSAKQAGKVQAKAKPATK